MGFRVLTTRSDEKGLGVTVSLGSDKYY